MLNARQRALLKYGTYCAVALVCGLLADPAGIWAYPMALGKAHHAGLAGVAAAMLFQAVALFRAKSQDCFIVRREELLGGSFILFIGAAMLMALLFAGCTPATARLDARQIRLAKAHSFNFCGCESTGTWTLFGADGPSSIAAQDHPERTQSQNQAPAVAAIAPAGGPGIAIVAWLKTAPALCRVENNRRRERAAVLQKFQ